MTPMLPVRVPGLAPMRRCWRHPVAAGGGGVAHGGDHYLPASRSFLILRQSPGGGGGTAGAVDADDYCLDLGVVFSLADRGHDGIGASGETAKKSLPLPPEVMVPLT